MVQDDSDQDARTLFCGNLSENVTEALLFELFLQGGPVERISIPKKEGKQCSFGFVTYTHSCSVPYAVELFAGTQLFGRELRINCRNGGGPPNNNRNQAQHQSIQQNHFHSNLHNEQLMHRPHARAGQIQLNPEQPAPNPFANNTSSLQTGFHAASQASGGHMDMRPSRGGGHRKPDVVENEFMDINKLMQMGAQMLSGGNMINSYNNGSSGSGGGGSSRGGGGGGRESGNSRGSSDKYNSTDRHGSRGSQQHDQNTAHPYRRHPSSSSRTNHHHSYDNYRSNNDRGHRQDGGGGGGGGSGSGSGGGGGGSGGHRRRR